MSYELGKAYIEEALRQFRGHKRLTEGALAQIDDEQFFRTLDPESNSVAIILKHMAGNMRSRFTDFLTSDGEKPWRHRDQEFEMRAGATRAEIMAFWEEGWSVVFTSVGALSPDDLLRTVTIRGQDHSVLQAINRQIAHYAYHCGQVLFLAKHMKGSAWTSLSIPRGMSEQAGAQAEKRRP